MKQRGLLAAILGAGVALQAMLWWRQPLQGDQFHLLLSGLEVLATGDLPPVGKETTGDGRILGALQPLLVAAPLALWPDYRAPGLLTGLSQVAAVAVLSHCIGRALGARFLAAWLAVYWLSPWRLILGGQAWEPAYLYLPAALHLASAYRLRERTHPGWSLLHAAALTAAVQLHHSCVVLLLLTAMLASARRIHLHVRGALVGALAGGLTLIPTAQALIAGDLPRILPPLPVELPRVAVGVMNLAKSVAYWFRVGSPNLELWLEQTASASGPPLARGLIGAVITATAAAAGLALFASWRWFRRRPSRDPRGRAAPADRLRAYAGWGFAALCTALAVSPVPVDGWDPLLAVHAAGRPVGVVVVASIVSAALALSAAWLWFRRRPPRDPDGPGRRASPEDWLRAYAGRCLAALCAAAVLSPLPMWDLYMAFVLHAACLPVAAWLRAVFRSRSVLPRAAAVAFILLQVVVVLLVAFDHPMYRNDPGDGWGGEPPAAVRALVPAGSFVDGSF